MAGRINKCDVTAALKRRCRVTRRGAGGEEGEWGEAGEGFGRVKRGRSENKETYIDSFPGKLGTAMLGEGGGCGSRRREVQGRRGEEGGKGRKKRRRVKEDVSLSLGTQTLVIK